jgi:hypothetical protein
MWAEVHGDETIEFESDLEEALEYDRSMVEFGEKESVLIMFMDDWREESPFFALWHWFVTYPEFCRLAADYVEKFIPIMRKHRPDLEAYVRESIDAVRTYMNAFEISGGSEGRKFSYTRSDLENQYRKMQNIRDTSFGMGSMEKGYPAAYTFEAALKIIQLGLGEYSTWPTLGSYMKDIRDNLSKAAAWDKTNMDSIQDFMNKRRKEESWQFHRLLDVLDSVLNGKPRPPLEETE